jgi:hypothetical protein
LADHFSTRVARRNTVDHRKRNIDCARCDFDRVNIVIFGIRGSPLSELGKIVGWRTVKWIDHIERLVVLLATRTVHYHCGARVYFVWSGTRANL